MGLNIRAGRIAAGAAAGALWACVSPFVVPEQGFQLMLAFGPVSVLMVYLAYRERRPKSLLHQAGGLYLTSALMSGGLSLLKRAVYGIVSDGQKGMAQSCLPFLALLSGAGFVCFSACFLWEAAGREKRLRSCRAETVLVCKGRQIQVKAFLDTGNQLYDPIFRRPVSVIWEGALNGLFDGTEGTSLIPYRSVGRENGMLPGGGGRNPNRTKRPEEIFQTASDCRLQNAPFARRKLWTFAAHRGLGAGSFAFSRALQKKTGEQK